VATPRAVLKFFVGVFLSEAKRSGASELESVGKENRNRKTKALQSSSLPKVMAAVDAVASLETMITGAVVGGEERERGVR